MSEQPAFTIEEWSVRGRGLHLETLAQTETLFALSNGYIGLRGACRYTRTKQVGMALVLMLAPQVPSHTDGVIAPTHSNGLVKL